MRQRVRNFLYRILQCRLSLDHNITRSIPRPSTRARVSAQATGHKISLLSATTQTLTRLLHLPHASLRHHSSLFTRPFFFRRPEPFLPFFFSATMCATSSRARTSKATDPTELCKMSFGVPPAGSNTMRSASDSAASSSSQREPCTGCRVVQFDGATPGPIAITSAPASSSNVSTCFAFVVR